MAILIPSCSRRMAHGQVILIQTPPPPPRLLVLQETVKDDNPNPFLHLTPPRLCYRKRLIMTIPITFYRQMAQVIAVYTPLLPDYITEKGWKQQSQSLPIPIRLLSGKESYKVISFSKSALPVARVQTLSAAGGKAEQRTKGGHSAWATLDPGCGQCLGSCALLTLSHPDLSRISTHRPCKETPQSKSIKWCIIMGRANLDSLQNMEKVKQIKLLFSLKQTVQPLKGNKLQILHHHISMSLPRLCFKKAVKHISEPNT